MLTIRTEQMAALSDYMLGNFITEMIDHLRSEYPEQTMEKSDADMRSFVRGGVDMAHEFNIRLSANLESFLEFVTLHGLDFQSRSELQWATTILADQAIDESEKMNRISEYAIFGGPLMAG